MPLVGACAAQTASTPPPPVQSAEKSSADEAPPTWRYRVAPSVDLDTIKARLCFTGQLPAARWLVPGEEECAAYLVDAALEVAGAEPSPLPIDKTRGIEITSIPPGACLTWTVDAGLAARRASSERAAERVGRDLVTSPDLWLYRPDAGDDRRLADVDMRAVFDLPAGVEVSTPWPREVRADVVEHRVRPTVWRWLNRVVFGRFRPLAVEVPGATLDVVVLDGPRAMSDDEVAAWIRRSGTAVATAYGRFPRSRAQVTVTPVKSWGSDAVPFGKVVRGGGPGVHLLLNQSARWPASFDDDWVSVHEMSHLTTPFLRDGGRWLSEGVATYYQTVLRARAGLLDEETAWQKLHEGFERGSDNGARGITLREASLDMWRSGNFLRVYWSGTAFALLTDIALRTRADPSSFDDALARFADCCLDGSRSWDDLAFLDRLDAGVGGELLRGLADDLLPGRAFPSLEGAYRALGITVIGGRVRLEGGPNERALRRAIMGPRQPAG